MVNIRERVFLISGTNSLQRQRAIASIKERILKGRELSLNLLTFYAKEVNPKDLGEKLFTTSFAGERVVIFKNLQDLSSAVRKFLFDNLKRVLSGNYLIFETDKDYYYLQRDRKFTNDKFFISVLKRAALFRVASTREKATIENFIASLKRNDLAASTYILEKLFAGGLNDKVLGPQIIGILVRKISFLKDSAEKDRYFKYLWEADRAIKEKGLDSRLVIESLLVKVLGPQ